MFRLPVVQPLKAKRASGEWESEAFRVSTYPDPTPPAWYAAASADELKPGGVLAFHLGEHRMVLFRSKTAPYAVSALDSYCPHLGADLAGGHVAEGGLVCPFHQWTFGGDGKVCHIPYTERIPTGLKTGAWLVEEHYGLLWVWYTRDPHQRLSPRYRLPPLPAGEVERGRENSGTIPMHLIDIVENGADSRHFHVLHNHMLVPYSRRAIPGMKVDFQTTDWEVDPADPFVAHLRVRSSISALGREIRRSRGGAHVRFIGPATLIMLSIFVDGVGGVTLIQSHTPEAPLLQRVRFRWFADPAVPKLLVWWAVGAWIGQVQEDFSIWAAKIHQKKPMILPSDGPILVMRRWFRQFYETPAAQEATVSESAE